ncbi:MAG: hypothetical protein AABY83_02200 [Pseudomonadota bacterium]
MNDTIDLRAGIPALAQQWRAGAWCDAEFAAIYFLYYQIARHGARFASRTARAAAKPRADLILNTLLNTPQPSAALIDFFSHHHFLQIIPNVNHAFVAWLQGRWRIQLLEHIPTPLEVLHLQTQGIRPATVVCSYPRLLQPVLTKRDGLHFLAHDLEHAYKFFHDPVTHLMQRQFFQALYDMANAGDFCNYLSDARFGEKFDYLISDMNTHVAHGVHFLRAILIESALRAQGKAMSEQVPPHAQQEVLGLLKKITQTCGIQWEQVMPDGAFIRETANSAA